MKQFCTLLVSCGLILCSAMLGTANAIPLLQCYIPDATWDDETETWFTTLPVFDLWVVGNLGHPGVGPDGILDVHMAAAYWSEEGLAGLLGGSGEISIAVSSAENHTIPDPAFDWNDPFGTQVAQIDGAVPIMETGDPLPTHGVYGPGVMFDQFYLGNFNGGGLGFPDREPIADFYGPGPHTYDGWGQINEYTVTLTGFPLASEGGKGVFFDVYNHISAERKSTFGPFSHNAGAMPVPEPTTLLVLGLGLFGAGGLRLLRRRDG
ncbi:MAG: choice-of-anchor N protein [Candidatus Eisenbacteria sp.]|nr:choice-of-anchor N protein [Candidatus Eisenbacteria bacterium]